MNIHVGIHMFSRNFTKSLPQTLRGELVLKVTVLPSSEIP